MGRILEFLNRFGNVFLFLALEFIAIVLVVNRNKHQQHVFNQLAAELGAGLHQKRSGVTQYFSLGSQNDLLLQENARLRREMLTLRSKVLVYERFKPADSSFIAIPDSSFSYDRYTFIPIRAIHHTIHKNYNYITLNKGSKNGVRPGLGVMSPDGVVGMVIDVSRHYAVAISLLNKSFKLSAKLQKNNSSGTLTWRGGSPEYATLDYIPETVELWEGDTVVTSSYSSVFPENFVVGTVASFHDRNQNGFHEIKVKLSTDFRGVDNLYLVSNDRQEEIDSLEAKVLTD